jgi:hypothetical protein
VLDALAVSIRAERMTAREEEMACSKEFHVLIHGISARHHRTVLPEVNVRKNESE